MGFAVALEYVGRGLGIGGVLHAGNGYRGLCFPADYKKDKQEDSASMRHRI